MEYLKRVLGIEVLYENKALEHLPNFISTRYDSQKVSLSGQKAVFLYPKTELEQVETLKKHLERVKKVADCPVILVLEQITARQKEYLLREKIAFIVDGKQIYLPFMAAYLQERCDAEKSDREEILPSAQMLSHNNSHQSHIPGRLFLDYVHSMLLFQNGFGSNSLCSRKHLLFHLQKL